MKMVKIGIAASACGAALMLCSCNTRPAEWEDPWVTQDIVAAPAAEGQIRIDGTVSDGEWNDAQEYRLARAKDWGYEKLQPRQRKREDTTPFERGFFKVKYDADNLYVLAVLDDADVVQTSREDQSLAFETGDTIEVFLKPEDQCAVWELYGTPWSKVTTFFHPWSGHSLRMQQKFHPGIKAVALAREVADPEKDKAGWTIEMAIPRELIEKTGGVFAPDKEWRILLCRYDYGKNLPSRQISSTPQLPCADHRMSEYYAKLKFKPKAEPKQKSPDKAETKQEEKKPEVKADTKSAEKKPEVKADAKPADKKPEVKPEAKPAEKKTEVKTEPKPVKPADKKPEAKADAKPAEKKPELKAEPKPVKTADKKPETEPAAKPAAEKKAEPKPVAKSAVEKKPASKPEPKPVVKPAEKPAATAAEKRK